MLRNIMFGLLALMLTVSFTGGACLASDKVKARKGKYAYRKIYKNCKARGEVKTIRPPISPNSKTQAQWQRMFDKKKFKAFGCQEEWSQISEEEMLNIYTYLYNHAADSPTPAKCK